MFIKMHEIMNKVLLDGYKFISEMKLKQPGFTLVLVAHSQKIQKELKYLYRKEIQTLFIKMILIKLVFNMKWLMVNQKI